MSGLWPYLIVFEVAYYTLIGSQDQSNSHYQQTFACNTDGPSLDTQCSIPYIWSIAADDKTHPLNSSWSSDLDQTLYCCDTCNCLLWPEKKENKTENLFSPYPQSESDINWYTRLKIAMSCYLQGKLAINCRPTAVRKLAIPP
jgi:hypothetical protein